MKHVVKSRQVGGSVVVTMPEGVPNLHYEVSRTLGGTYIYTPVEKRSVKPSSLQVYNMELSNYGTDKGADNGC